MARVKPRRVLVLGTAKSYLQSDRAIAPGSPGGDFPLAENAYQPLEPYVEYLVCTHVTPD